MISLAAEVAARRRYLAPDFAADDDSLITSLCEFDFLHAITLADAVGTDDPRLRPTSFAAWFSWRTDPIAAELITPGSAVRTQLFDKTDLQLADTLAAVEQTAWQGWGLPGPAWEGYEDRRVREFIGRFRRE